MGFISCVAANPKRVIYILYTVLLIYGLGILSWGIAERIRMKEVNTMAVGLRIAFGVVSTLNSVMGIYGTSYDDRCLVVTSNILMFVTCDLQILLIIIRITMPAKDSAAQRAELQELFDKEDEEEFHEIERDMECCGVAGYNDYEQKYDPLLLGYPSSCCEEKVTKCLKPYEYGCHQMIMEAQHREEMIRAFIFLSSSFVKFVSAIVIAVLTIWGDDIFSGEIDDDD